MAKPASLPGWNTRLLVHARAKEAASVATLSGQEGLGAVIVTSGGPAQARVAMTRMRELSEVPSVMFDADRYSGKNRKVAQAGIDTSWLIAQQKLGVTWPLTDSGYIGDADVTGLRCILLEAEQFDGHAVAALPLASSWWDDGAREVLINEVGERAVPVALILEHTDDPFSALSTVRGVVTFLAAARVPVLILRTDLSGLGVLAFGGTAAAIGTSSSLRHLFPVLDKDGFGRQSQISMLWPRGLAYRSVEKLTDAIAADPDSPNWLCNCSACYGRSIEWILNSEDQHTNAFRHSVAASRLLANELESATLSEDDRQTSWLETCRIAQSFSWEVAGVSGKAWQPPRSLSAWNRAIPAPVR